MFVPSLALGSDKKNEIVDSSSRNGFPSLSVWAQPLRWGEEPEHSGGAHSRATAPLHLKESLQVVWASV